MHPFSRPATMKGRCHCAQISLLLAGIILISCGLGIFIYLENIYEYILNTSLKFSPESEAYKAWRTNDPPLHMDLYLFNWTNPNDIRNSSVKPRFEEVGPYRCFEVKEKTNITWHENSTVSFLTRRLYYFDEKNSPRKLSDIISTVNVVPLTVSYQAKNYGYFAKRLISLGISGVSRLFVTKTAEEIFFKGYEEPILSTLSNFPMLNVADRFGFFYGKNNTIGRDGHFNMYYANDKNFGKIKTWNYKNHTNFYEGSCNTIRGSAGEFYPLHVKRDKLVLYNSELCKYAELEYVEDVMVKGILGYKFTGDNIFDNGTTRPENACFCKGECIPSGVFNVSACRQDSPTFLSFPHFYNADPYYTDLIEGMRPDKSKHEFYVIIEPNSGIIMEINAHMQVNMLLQPVRHINLYANLPKVFMPMFYFTQKIELRESLVSSLRLIQNLPEYMNYTCIILLTLGLASIFGGLFLYFCRCRNRDMLKISKKTYNNTQYEEVAMNVKE